MTKDEYIEKHKQITQRYKEELDGLAITYAKSNRKYQIGDIVKCDYCIIKIDKISVYKSANDIENCYSGTKLRKNDLTPYANGATANIWQSRITMKLSDNKK